MKQIRYRFLVLARQLDIRVISLDVPYSADVKVDVDAYMTNVVDVAVDPVEGKHVISEKALVSCKYYSSVTRKLLQLYIE